MKKEAKWTNIALVILCMTVTICSVSVKAEAKDRFWLSGISKPAGGSMTMYYKGNALLLKGEISVADSRKKAKYILDKPSCQYRIAKKCKVFLYEAENVTSYPYKKWVKIHGYKKNDKITFISADLKVEGKKITRIEFSA